mmetsp:Transcript_44487/g.72386  ORF Transcript_44487/g.72386 Transcript_44487/m.72386 type:complete len:231 (+) Transcript_44487:239-931(+)
MHAHAQARGGAPAEPLSFTASKCKFATQNVNGLLTKVLNNEDTVLCCELLLRFLLCNHIHVMGIREPHTKSDDESTVLRKKFADKPTYFLSNITPQRRGGTAIIWDQHRTLLGSWSLEPRILFASFPDPDGIIHNFLVSHFHHDVPPRTKQWRHIHKGLAPLLPDDTIFLLGHNSVIVPTRDGHCCTPTHPRAVDSRDIELPTMGTPGLVDTYAALHAGCMNDFGFQLTG